jgi:flavin-dependent dehydrogenase
MTQTAPTPHHMRAEFGSGIPPRAYSDIEVDWPGPSFPATGSTVPRTELDKRIRPLAATTGASMLVTSKVVDIKHDSCGRVFALDLSQRRPY